MVYPSMVESCSLILAVDGKYEIAIYPRCPVFGIHYRGVTHDSVSHGTATLFAALDIANGTVRAACKDRHRHQEFLSFWTPMPRTNMRQYVDGSSDTHGFTCISRRLYSSWLNQVEQRCAIVIDREIRRGSFANVGQMRHKIMTFVDAYTERAVPFRWMATADSIFEKLQWIHG